MRFRILKYLPPTRTPPRPPRPRPAITQDNAFWFEGAREHKLLIQRCTSCGTLRHPPLPACGTCGSFEWDTVEASGRGTLYSFVVVHYPQVPRSNTRCRSAWSSSRRGRAWWRTSAVWSPAAIVVGMELRAEFVDHDDELSLPVVRRRPGSSVQAGGPDGLRLQRGAARRLGGGDRAVLGAGGPRARRRPWSGRDDRIDRALWRALADADLLGLAVPESEGGAGHGLMELCLLLEAQGNAVAPVPLWATLVLGALPIAHFGSEAQRARWLPGVVSGDVVLTAALTGSAASPTSSPAVRGDGTRRRLGARRHRAGGAPGAPGGPDRGAGPYRGRRRAARARRPGGARRLARARPDHQPRGPSAPASRRGDGRGRGGPGRCRRRPFDARLPVGGGHDRVVRAAGRRVRGGAHTDRGLPERPSSVRAPAEHVPGHDAAGGGRRHRHRGDAGHLAERRVALRQRARRRRRGVGGQMAGLRARAADGARHPTPPRRHGCGHHLPDPPLLPVGQADRAAPGRPERATGAARRGHRRAGAARTRRRSSDDGAGRRGRPSSTSRSATSCRRSSCPSRGH